MERLLTCYDRYCKDNSRLSPLVQPLPVRGISDGGYFVCPRDSSRHFVLANDQTSGLPSGFTDHRYSSHDTKTISGIAPPYGPIFFTRASILRNLSPHLRQR
jgi:hypothetical protein